jgi:hypothetical protein
LNIGSKEVFFGDSSGLPDFPDTIYQNGENIYKITPKLPNDHEIYQMANIIFQMDIKYTNIFPF